MTDATEDVTVTLSTADGTATAGEDYEPLDGAEVIVPADTGEVTVGIAIIADEVGEAEETLAVTIDAVSGGADIDDGTATVTITADEVVAVAGGPTVVAIDGADPTDASVQLAQITYTGLESAFAQGGGLVAEVLLASDTVFADALASGALQDSRPLLLNDRDVLEPAVAAELARLGPDRVRILGGTAAIVETVEAELVLAGYDVVRTAGPTRLETAVEIARVAASADTGLIARAFPAAGGDDTQAFADSLAAGGWAAANGWPLFLTQTEVFSGSPRDHLADNPLVTAHLIGGEGAISSAVADGLASLAGASNRWAGPTRFATAIAIANARGFSTTAPASHVVVTEGQAAHAWAGGFASAAWSGANDAPVVLANGETLPEETLDFLATTTTEDVTVLCVADPAACAAVEARLTTERA